MNPLEDWQLWMMECEERLRPIGDRPVDITRPGWAERLEAGVPPLDEPGVRDKADELLKELIATYARSNESVRAAIRGLFVEYRSFAWASTLSIAQEFAEAAYFCFRSKLRFCCTMRSPGLNSSARWNWVSASA